MKPYIPAVSILVLDDMPFDDMLEKLAPYLLEEIPEGTIDGNPDRMMEIDRLIGRFANLYAYVAFLYAYTANRAHHYKAEGFIDEWHAMVRKKDALYEFRGAIKLKWQACSRMVTVNLDDDPADRIDYEARREYSNKPTPATNTGWNHVA